MEPTANWCDIGQVTIDILPDDVLLIIFDYYVAEADEDDKYEEWQKLVHVCQNWRYVVFGSPLRLNLRILCSGGTPVREKLAVWPPLPIVVADSTYKCGKDNIMAALGHNDRICKIDLLLPSSLLEIVFAAMQKTFVALKHLSLHAGDGAPAVPDSLLGGSAPHLRHLILGYLLFPSPTLRNLLLSAPNLVMLSLQQHDIPQFEDFSPEALATCLSAFTRLKLLRIGIESSQSRPGGRHPIHTRSVLPALTELRIIGVSEYLEDLVAHFDAPLLDNLDITITSWDHIMFDTPQLLQFISRAPKLKSYDEARITFCDIWATIALSGGDNPGLQWEIPYGRSDWQPSLLVHICTSLPQALTLKLEHLYILENEYEYPFWVNDMENIQRLELFHPFTTVKNLYLSQEFVPLMQGLVGERVTEVLPNLQGIFLVEDLEKPGFVPETIQQFIAARQLSSCPIAISYWTRQGSALHNLIRRPSYDKWSSTP